MFQQQERDVVVAVTAGVPVHGCHQRVQRLLAVGGAQRGGDLIFREELTVPVTAFDQPVGVEQQPVARRPARGERGEVILQAQRQDRRPAGQRFQAAAVAQQRRVMAAVDNGELAAGVNLGEHRGDEVLLAQVRPDRAADLARHLLYRGQRDRAAPERAQHLPGQHDGIQALAADVADDHPDAAPGGDDLVQVTANRSLTRRGAVAGGDADSGHLGGQRRKQR